MALIVVSEVKSLIPKQPWDYRVMGGMFLRHRSAKRGSRCAFAGTPYLRGFGFFTSVSGCGIGVHERWRGFFSAVHSALRLPAATEFHRAGRFC